MAFIEELMIQTAVKKTDRQLETIKVILKEKCVGKLYLKGWDIFIYQ